MILFKRPKILFFVASLVVAGAPAGEVDLEKALGSLIAAEKAYAKAAGEKGFREASISAFADDAVIFTPNPVNGKKFWQQTKEDPVISWRPTFAAIARSGDLGYTTGPAEFRNKRTDAQPVAFGDFVSIWRKKDSGAWKVIVDVGISHPQPTQAQNETTTYIPNTPVPNTESASADLDKLQREFTELLKDDEADAIIEHASDDIRIYRRGQVPAVGKKAAKKMLSDVDAKTTCAPTGAGSSHPVDLAYEYGEYTSKRDDTTERGIYLCIWRLESDGAWKIALDLQKSAPEKK
jgi:ketosteroid isomerase-like protein